MFTLSPLLIWMNLFDGCPSPLLYLVSGEPSQWELSPSGKWWQLDYENMPSQKPSSKTSENMNMRKWKSKARFQNDFLIPVLLFMSNVGQCPLLAFCVETCDGLKCFSGECLGGRGLGGGFTWKKQNQNAKYRGWVVFSARNRMYDSHTSSADNRPSSDKFPVLSLAPDLPHTLYYCHFIFPPTHISTT